MKHGADLFGLRYVYAEGVDERFVGAYIRCLLPELLATSTPVSETPQQYVDESAQNATGVLKIACRASSRTVWPLLKVVLPPSPSPPVRLLSSLRSRLLQVQEITLCRRKLLRSLSSWMFIKPSQDLISTAEPTINSKVIDLISSNPSLPYSSTSDLQALWHWRKMGYRGDPRGVRCCHR